MIQQRQSGPSRSLLLRLLLIFLIGVVLWIIFGRTTPFATKAKSEAETSESRSAASQIPAAKEAPQSSERVPSIPSSKAAANSNYNQYRSEQIKIDRTFDWKQPINFYGKVVDESNQPVAGATATFQRTDLSPGGTSKDRTVSDSNGLFSLVGRTGKLLMLSVAKEGYYSVGAAKVASFEYANPYDGRFIPDPSNPVLFRLKKKGPGTDLITSQYGVKPDLGMLPPSDGTPVSVDLLARKVGTAGQLIVQAWKEPKDFTTGQNTWGLRLSAADGGFVGQTDELPFEAPEQGYAPNLEWHFTNGQPGWEASMKTNFYVKFGSPPKYGWLKVETSAFSQALYLDYAINPDGSRYLEPK